MKKQYLFEILISSLFVIFLIILFLDQSEIITQKYTIVRPEVKRLEAFTDLHPEDYNSSYSLLSGVYTLKEKQTSSKMNSQRCYEGDFQKRLEQVGNFKQLTNNYKRGDPDSCSAPLQEFVSAYYDIKPLN